MKVLLLTYTANTIVSIAHLYYHSVFCRNEAPTDGISHSTIMNQ